MSLSAYFTWALYSARKKCLFWVCAYSEEKCTHFQSDYGVLTSPQVRSDGQPGEESCLCQTFILMVLASTLIGIFSYETLLRQMCVLLNQIYLLQVVHQSWESSQRWLREMENQNFLWYIIPKQVDFALQEWLEAADIRVELLQYLKEQVPTNFCLKTEPSPEEEDEFMQVDLLHPLECFLFGEDPREGLEKLKQGCSSSQLCGRVFKEGETVYSCRSEYRRFPARGPYWLDICKLN